MIDDICKRNIYIYVYPTAENGKFNVKFVDIRTRREHFKFVQGAKRVIGKKLTVCVRDFGLNLSNDDCKEVAKWLFEQSWQFTSLAWEHVRNE